MKLLFFLVFTLTSLFSQSFFADKKINANGRKYTDSLISAFNTISELNGISVFSSWIEEQSKYIPASVNISLCSEKPVLVPKLYNWFDDREYRDFMKNPGRTLQDSCNFLLDNDIKGYWYRVYYSSDTTVGKIERIGTDINVDFGKVLSTSFYKKGRIFAYVNSICDVKENTVVIRFFDMDKDQLCGESMQRISEKEIIFFFLNGQHDATH